MAAVVEERRPGRAGIDAAALRLFGEHGVAGTSLQMIADSLGLAKSAVYYHYRSKDELVLGVLSPLLAKLPGVLERAQACRGRIARADALVAGLVALVIDEGPRYSVMAGDPTVTVIIGRLDWVQGWYDGAVALLAGPDPDPGALIAISMFFTSLGRSPHDPALADLEPEAVREGLLAGSRRLLRLPRRPAPPGPVGAP